MLFQPSTGEGISVTFNVLGQLKEGGGLDCPRAAMARERITETIVRRAFVSTLQ